MCGRFALSADAETLAELFELPALALPLQKRFNIAPSQQVLVIRLDRDGQRRLDMIRWGLVPHWSKKTNLDSGLINARAETLAEKPAFRQAWQRRRCLVVADGFYEWQRTPRGKQPYFIRLRDRAPFAFAGLWERWHDPTGAALDSCAIVTTDANELVRPIHERMPVILDPPSFNDWLAREGADLDALRGLLAPPRAERFEAIPVATHVNKPDNDDPSCIEAQGEPRRHSAESGA